MSRKKRKARHKKYNPKGNGESKNTIPVIMVHNIGVQADDKGNVIWTILPPGASFAIDADSALKVAELTVMKAEEALQRDKRIVIVNRLWRLSH